MKGVIVIKWNENSELEIESSVGEEETVQILSTLTVQLVEGTFEVKEEEE